jgi:hypothetical protein
LGKVFSGGIADEGNVLNEAAEINVNLALVFSAVRTFVQRVFVLSLLGTVVGAAVEESEAKVRMAEESESNVNESKGRLRDQQQGSSGLEWN